MDTFIESYDNAENAEDNKFTNLGNRKCEFMLVNNEFSDDDKKLNPIIKSIVTKEQFESMKYKVGE